MATTEHESGQNKTRRMLIKSDKYITVNERVQIIGYRAQELEHGAQPYIDVGSCTKTELVAIQEYYEGKLDEDYCIRRYYNLGRNNRFYRDFRVGELIEPEAEVSPFFRTKFNALSDLHGRPPKLGYLSEEELEHCVEAACSQISYYRGPFEFVRQHHQKRMRAFLKGILRLTPFPNTVQHLYRIGFFLGHKYNMAQNPAHDFVATRLNDAVVDPQGVISSFHKIGTMDSALSMHVAADQLINGNFKQRGDYLSFKNDGMTPMMAIEYDRRYSDLRFQDFFKDTTVMEFDSSMADMPLYKYFLKNKKVSSQFVRLYLNAKLMCWHRLQLTSVSHTLSRGFGPDVLLVCHTQSSAIIDVFFCPHEEDSITQQIYNFKNCILPKVKGIFKDKSVRGVTAYMAHNYVTTSCVLKEINYGAPDLFLWHVDINELYINVDGDPLSDMLTHIDPDVKVTNMENQMLIRISVELMRKSIAKINEMREVCKTMLLNTNHAKAIPEDDDIVIARLMSRHSDVSLTPLSIITAMGEEEIALYELRHEQLMTPLMNSKQEATLVLQCKLWKHISPRVNSAALNGFARSYRKTSLHTIGSNILDNLVLPNVDPRRSYPYNPTTMLHFYGVEPMRLQLLRILINSFSKKSKHADPAHLILISQIMTTKGSLHKLSDFSREIEPFLKDLTRSRAMFEFVKGGLSNIKNDAGVLTDQIAGQVLRGGTGANTVFRISSM
jgi:DNA-directed RNA polymerase subunit K/omega